MYLISKKYEGKCKGKREGNKIVRKSTKKCEKNKINKLFCLLFQTRFIYFSSFI